MKTDLEISQSAVKKNITEIAAAAGIAPGLVECYGREKAKISLEAFNGKKPAAKLILVTAINPTKAGEGKTTCAIGLADSLAAIGKKTFLALREPSLGPVFGLKGGATGGGHAQVVPMEDINLHFTGDIHAITTANNLIAACIDNHIHFGNALEIENANFGVVVFDLNFLKETNDTYGHDVGDKLIATSAKLIADVFKRSPVFRIGGDEFVAVLQYIDLENCEELLKHLDTTCANTFIQETGNAPISIASGFAIFDREQDKSLSDVFKRADKAMYENKRKNKKDRSSVI